MEAVTVLLAALAFIGGGCLEWAVWTWYQDAVADLPQRPEDIEHERIYE